LIPRLSPKQNAHFSFIIGNSHMSELKTDDLDAVRAVIEAIKDFKSDEQKRIFRWAAEVGIATAL